MRVNLLETSAEFHNLEVIGGDLRVRRGIQTARNLDYRILGNTSTEHVRFVYGFSTTSATSSRVSHYVFWLGKGVDDSVNTLEYTILDEDLLPLGGARIGELRSGLTDLRMSHTTLYNQIIVNGPDLPFPIWGYSGGTLIRANPVPSINPDTPALTLYPGLVARFGDRIAWAYANNVIFNDPGIDPRTITEPNAIALGGRVTDMFQQGEGGVFVVITTDGVYRISQDALAGYQFDGQIVREAGYEGVRERTAATVRRGTAAINDDGLINLQDWATRSLIRPDSRPAGSRTVGNRVGTPRDHRLIAGEDSYWVFDGRSVCRVDTRTGFASWFYRGTEVTDVCGILRDADGNEIYVGVFDLWLLHGVQDLAGIVQILTPTKGWILTGEPTDPQRSPVLREITLSGDRPGFQVSSRARGSLQTATIPAGFAPLAGTAVWGADVTPATRDYRSRRMQRAVRGDSPEIELGWTGCDTRTSGEMDIQYRGRGRQRPNV